MSMARIRTIKPEFFQHESLFDAEQQSRLPLRLAYVGLWTQCDRAGRFEWRPRQLKLNVLPYDDVDFSAVLSALEAHGFVQRYVVEERTYGFIPSWEDHQHINVREPSSTIPAPEHDDSYTGHVPDDTGTEPVPVPPQDAGKGKERERERKGKEREDACVHALATVGLDREAFERWQLYRSEIGKPLKPSSLVACAEALVSKYGDAQMAVVKQSIENGWQGLFPLKSAPINGSAIRRPPARPWQEIEAEEKARGQHPA